MVEAYAYLNLAGMNDEIAREKFAILEKSSRKRTARADDALRLSDLSRLTSAGPIAKGTP